MAPRAYWKGSLKLSLVTCPVALYPVSTAIEAAARTVEIACAPLDAPPTRQAGASVRRKESNYGAQLRT